MIANCSGDERGKLRGGKAGDQTGREWRLKGWYNRPWNVILRFEDTKIADMIATLAEEGANNNKIGYDQGDRLSFWRQLEKSGYRPKNIKTACETDCSASTLAICKATGFLLGKYKLQAVSTSGYSGNIRSILKTAGAKVLTEKKYLTSDKYLLRGDILVYEGHHVAINLTDGSNAKKPTTAKAEPAKQPETGKYTGAYPVLTNGRKDEHGHGWYEYGDGMTKLKDYPTQIKRVQALVNWINGGSIPVDGEFGAKTLDAVKKAQKALKVTVTGKFDYATLEAAKKFTK